MIETKMEHPHIETDPVAELEAYRAHMEAVQNKLNAELALEREARLVAEQDRDLARQELASARGAADQWKQNTTNMARRLKRDTEEFKQEKKELQEQIRQMSRRPVRVPVAGMAGTAVLAFLVAAAVEAQLVDHIIGEPIPSRNLIIPVPKDRIAPSGKEVQPPKGATLLHRSEYSSGRPQYIRYIIPKKPKPDGDDLYAEIGGAA